PAHRAHDLVDGRFDLVLLSSTVQFFPDVEYLYDTLAAVLGLLRPGGRVIVADVIPSGHFGLTLDRGVFDRIGDVLPGAGVTVHDRTGTGLPAELAARYDVELVCGGGTERVRTFWTGADIRETPVPTPVAVDPGDPAYAI